MIQIAAFFLLEVKKCTGPWVGAVERTIRPAIRWVLTQERHERDEARG